MSNLKLSGASTSKAPLGVVPDGALVGAARVFEDGGVKYEPGNFLNNDPIDKAIAAYDSALMRHRRSCRPLSGIATARSYAAIDEDSGLPHIDHMIAGLIIARAIMIRDGVLPEDPGQGRHVKDALALASKPLAEQLASREMVRRCKLKLDTSDPEIAAVYETCKQAAAEVASWPAWKRGEPNDPDAARFATVDEQIAQREREAKEAAEQKRKWDQRCVPCNGTGKIEHDPDERGNCYKCNGTGQRTGAEGVSW